MMRRLAIGIGLVFALALSVQADSPKQSSACTRLIHLKLGDVTIINAGSQTPEAASNFAGSQALYCKIIGKAQPTRDSDIRFEVLIPEGRGWNGRYLQIGNGGFAGTIPERGMMPALSQGFAVAATDDGHQSLINTDASWALAQTQKQIDFGYRAIKQTTNAAKAIIRIFKGTGPRYSYFQGCSDGGREALMEAQRYPKDFDGIVSGDPANHWTHLLAEAGWNYQALTASPESFIPPDKLKLIEAEAIRQCGDEAGVIEDPLGCQFKPEQLRCANIDTPSCLTDAQIIALNKIYQGLIDPTTGEIIMDGVSPGGEAEPAGWQRWITGTARDDKQALLYLFAENFFSFFVFADPNFDLKTLNFKGDIIRTDKKFAKILNSYNPDLSAFREHGGKLIQYHGWADPAIPAKDSIRYYKLVQSRMGATDSFYRLFLAPGMLHCAGGPGPNVIDTLPAIMAWVEQGKAPATLVATKYTQDNPALTIERRRPLCAFPARAEWDGQGDKEKLESYRCVTPN